MRRVPVIAALTAAAVLTLGLALAAAPAASAATTGVYAALGDSYSSGEGVPPFQAAPAGDTCHRSAKAYSQLDLSTAGFPSTGNFKACSGATVNDFYNGMDTEPSQLAQLNASDSLVTLTLGGNDVGFASSLQKCITTSHCQNSLGAATTAAIAATVPRLATLYSAILAAAPNAQVYVLGYPIFISPKPGLVCQLLGLAPDETSWMGAMTSAFDSAVASTIAGLHSPRLHFVADLGLFAGKEACSSSGADVNGVNPLHPEYSFHPTAAGQALMAAALATAVRAG